MISNPEIYFNVSMSTLRQTLAAERERLKESRSKLKAMTIPTSDVKGFEVTVALEDMRRRAELMIDAAGDVVTAMEAMQAAQIAGHCAVFAQQEAAMLAARRRMYEVGASINTGTDDLQDFIGSFAGGDRKLKLNPAPPKYDPVADNARKRGYLAAELAVPLRCPLPDISFVLEVKLPKTPGGRVVESMTPEIRVISISDPAQRSAIEGRFKDFIVRPTYQYAGWALLGQPLRFKGVDQHMAPDGS